VGPMVGSGEEDAVQPVTVGFGGGGAPPGSLKPALRIPASEVTQLEEGVAGQLRCLLDPARHELLVESVVLVDVEVARVRVL
jgi:hypothetical protein